MPELLPWHHMLPQDVLVALHTSTDGLSLAQVQERLQIHGYNRLRSERGAPIGKIFVRQLVNPLVFILALAVGLSLYLGHHAESILTLLVMFGNAAMGFFQEYQAERALLALKRFLPNEVSVRRAGQIAIIPAEEIVPGDILLLGAGTQVPADARLLVAKDVSANEAALTGESAEVMKKLDGVAVEAPLHEQVGMLFAGSTLQAGKAEAVVVATGKETHFGKITEMVAGVADDQTPLQTELVHLTRWLVVAMVLAAATVFAMGLVRGLPLVEILSTSAALAVAAVPEGLLVSVTVILTVGMRRMLKRQALVRKLVAAETLGSVTVLCVDKTGTLTTGVMQVSELRLGTQLLPLDGTHRHTQDFLRQLQLVNTAKVEMSDGKREILGSVTEVSILRFLLDRSDQVHIAEAAVIDELPFDSEIKYSAVLVRDRDAEYALVFGAPDVLLERCDLPDLDLRKYRSTLDDMARRGLRVLLLASKADLAVGSLDTEHLRDLTPIGLVGLQDPVRPHAAQTLRQAMAAGVRVIMITGDHPVTASAIAQELGLSAGPGTMLLGTELATLSEAELYSRLRTLSVCARILPEQKFQIVRGLQALGATVAMTGDGVNDTPALRAADIGVAVGSGTEAAKESADMVILDNDVRSLIAAIREGRVVFDNIRKVLTHLLTFSMSELVLIAVLIALGLPVPLWPLHILWINLVTDGLPSLALAFEPAEPHIMQEPPRARHTPLLSSEMRRLMLCTGLLAVGSLLVTFIGLRALGFELDVIRTVIFVMLGLDSLTAIFPLRSLRRPFWKIPPLHNPQLLGAFAFGLLALLLPVLWPQLATVFRFAGLGVSLWGLIIGAVMVKLLLIEAAKTWFLEDIRRGKAGLVSLVEIKE